MKKTTTLLAAAVVLALGAVSAQAQFTYVDAIDFSLHPDGPLGDPFAFPGNENTFIDDGFGNKTAPWVTDASGTGQLWRFRNTGPAAVAVGTSAYEGRLNDDEVFTILTGLTSGQTYTLSLYGVWTTRNATWGLAYSLDGGSSWSGTIDSLDVEFANDNLGVGQGWVDTLGNKIPTDYGSATDTRGNVIIGTAVADGSGQIMIGVRAAPNTVSERGVYDGIGYALGVIPEPSTFALMGLGSAALLIFRRRS